MESWWCTSKLRMCEYVYILKLNNMSIYCYAASAKSWGISLPRSCEFFLSCIYVFNTSGVLKTKSKTHFRMNLITSVKWGLWQCITCVLVKNSILLANVHKLRWISPPVDPEIQICDSSPGDSDAVQFSHSVVHNSLWPQRLQHTRPPCPSPTPGIHSNSCPLSQWCHPAISSSVVPFSSCLQSFSASASFPVSQLFTPGGQSIGASASASVLPMNIRDWSPLGWTGWISLQSKGLSRVLSNTTVQKHQFSSTQLSL